MTDHTATTTDTLTTAGSLRESFPSAEDRQRSYDSVPFFRKRWMIMTLFLVFIPAMIVLCLSGPVYQNDKGRAIEWEPKQRYTAAIGGAMFMAISLLRLFAMPAAG